VVVVLTYYLKLSRIPRATIQLTSFQGTKNAWFHVMTPLPSLALHMDSQVKQSPKTFCFFRLQSVALLTSLAAVHGTKCWASIVLLKFWIPPFHGGALNLCALWSVRQMVLVHQKLFFFTIVAFFWEEIIVYQ
jgi:hypothetical protein